LTLNETLLKSDNKTWKVSMIARIDEIKASELELLWVFVFKIVQMITCWELRWARRMQASSFVVLETSLSIDWSSYSMLLQERRLV